MIEDKILMTARYVEGDLDEQEFADYERRLNNDDELRTHLLDYNQIHQSLKMHLGNDAAFLHTLQTNNKQFFRDEHKGFKLQPVLKWATAVAAVCFIALFIWAPWNTNLYKTYSADQHMSVAERGAESNELDKAAALFNEKKFVEANLIFEKLSMANPSDAMVKYYYGLSLTAVNKLEQARKLLTIVHNGESIYKYDATFAIALSYLKNDDKNGAKKWLRKIPASANQHEKAILLLDKLKYNK